MYVRLKKALFCGAGKLFSDTGLLFPYSFAGVCRFSIGRGDALGIFPAPLCLGVCMLACKKARGIGIQLCRAKQRSCFVRFFAYKGYHIAIKQTN
jgi:hypothetical protein